MCARTAFSSSQQTVMARRFGGYRVNRVLPEVRPSMSPVRHSRASEQHGDAIEMDTIAAPSVPLTLSRTRPSDGGSSAPSGGKGRWGKSSRGKKSKAEPTPTPMDPFVKVRAAAFSPPRRWRCRCVCLLPRLVTAAIVLVLRSTAAVRVQRAPLRRTHTAAL